MKLIFTSTLFFFVVIGNATGGNVDSIPVKAIPAVSRDNGSENRTIEFTCRAGATISPDKPIVIIDGKPVEFSEINEIKPADIASVEILKDNVANAICGKVGRNGVIIITTRAKSQRKFIIKDFLTGETVPFATARFKSSGNIMKAVADKKGVIIIDKLEPGSQVTVSSAGYQTLTTIAGEGEQDILLERDIIMCPEVKIRSYPAIICRRLTTTTSRELLCSVSGVTITTDDGKKEKIKNITSCTSVFPNPLQRGNQFNIELQSERVETILVNVISLNGNMVLQQSEKIIKGINRLSILTNAKWAAGVYIIQLRDESGTVVKEEKLVIQ